VLEDDVEDDIYIGHGPYDMRKFGSCMFLTSLSIPTRETERRSFK
jgi:hypothetical protein